MAGEIDLQSDYSARGQWWLPGQADKVVPGLLRFTPDSGLTLELDDVPTGYGFVQDPMVDCPIMHGLTKLGRSCTLVDGFCASRSFTSGGGGQSTFHFNLAFVGYELLDPAISTFDLVIARVTNLYPWTSREPIQASFTTTKAKMSYNRPSSIDCEMTALNAKLSIEPRFRMSLRGAKRTYEFDDVLVVRPVAPQRYTWFHDAIARITTLLTLMMGEHSSLISVKIVNQKRDPQHHTELTDVLFQQATNPKSRHLEHPQIPLPYSVVSPYWSSVVESWCSLWDQLRAPASLLLGITLSRTSPLEFQFIAAMQAVEALNRARRGNSYMSSDDFEPVRAILVDAIPKTIPADAREALKSRIKYGYEFSLRKRLKDFTDELSAEFKAALAENVASFIDDIVNTRNYLTHRDTDTAKKGLDLHDMHDATKKLLLLLARFLLTEAGVPPELADRLSRYRLNF